MTKTNHFTDQPKQYLIVLLLMVPILSDRVVSANEVDSSIYYDPQGSILTITEADLPVLNEGAELNAYLQYALIKNPGLKAVFDNYKAALQRVTVAKALPDPMVSYTEFLEEIQTRTGPQESRIMLSQKFPWFGKLKTKGEIAALKAESLWWAFETKRLGLVRDVKKTFYAYLLLKESIRLVRNNLELLQQLEPVVQKRIQGGANQNDLLRLQVEIGKLENQLDTLKVKRPAISSKLDALLNRKNDELLNWPMLFEPIVHNVSQSESQQKLIQKNTELQILHKLKVSKEKGVHLAKLERYPNLGVGLSVMQTGDALNPGLDGSGDDPLGLTISASVPLWFNKNKALIEQSKYSLSAINEQIENKENLLTAELALIFFEIEDSGRQILLYRDVLLPRARQSLKITEIAYQSSKASLLDVIDSERTLINFEMLFWKSATKHQQSLADLEWIEGGAGRTGLMSSVNTTPFQDKDSDVFH